MIVHVHVCRGACVCRHCARARVEVEPTARYLYWSANKHMRESTHRKDTDSVGLPALTASRLGRWLCCCVPPPSHRQLGPGCPSRRHTAVREPLRRQGASHLLGLAAGFLCHLPSRRRLLGISTVQPAALRRAGQRRHLPRVTQHLRRLLEPHRRPRRWRWALWPTAPRPARGCGRCLRLRDSHSGHGLRGRLLVE